MRCTPVADGVCVPCLLVEGERRGLKGEDSGGEEEEHGCADRDAHFGLYSGVEFELRRGINKGRVCT